MNDEGERMNSLSIESTADVIMSESADRASALPLIQESVLRDRDFEELSPVYQFPIARTVATNFLEVGRQSPLPFPDSDD